MKQLTRKSVSMFLTLLMVFSLFVLPASAEETTAAAPVNVSVRIEGMDKTLAAETELAVENFDLAPFGATQPKASATALHALIDALGLQEAGEELVADADGGWITSILGVESAGNYSWMYTVNNAMESVGCAQYALQEGDSIVFYYSDWTVGSYSFFTEDALTVKLGEEFTLTLKELGYDENWNTVELPVAGAALLIAQGEAEDKTETITAEDGTVSMSFANAGTYKISAVRETEDGKIDISRPLCVVTVESFPDIAGEEYKDEIEFLAAKGIFVGDENGSFNPDMTVTREQIAKILFALTETDVAVLDQYTESAFADVSMDSWSAKYIMWAVENVGVAGDGTNFYPQMEVAPEHLELMLNHAGLTCEIELAAETITRAEFAYILHGILNAA